MNFSKGKEKKKKKEREREREREREIVLLLHLCVGMNVYADLLEWCHVVFHDASRRRRRIHMHVKKKEKEVFRRERGHTSNDRQEAAIYAFMWKTLTQLC